MLSAAFAMSIQMNARDINVRGIVTNTDGEPLAGVCIYDVETDRLLGGTNDDGKFLVVTNDEGRLLFSILGMEETEVAVNGRLTIDVTLIASAITLDVVTVKAKAKLKNVLPEPTDIEIKGNYAHIKTRVRVPRRMFDPSTRLIIQPALYNVTAKKMWYLKPVVYDGERYQITQERMYDWDPTLDPLNKYMTVKSEKTGLTDVIVWSDSVYLDNPQHDFHCDMLMAMENYNRVFYRDTTTIARGTINPMRFFQYNLIGSEVTDSAYFPSPEMQMRDTRGDIRLTFKVDDARLNMDLANNRAEMNSLLDQLHRVENDPNAALKSFTISSTSSPEGRYEHNLDLSERRMKSALDFIMANLSPTSRKYTEVYSDAKVENWSTLSALLKADSLMDEAAQIDAIVARTPGNPDLQSIRIRKLPFYESVIAERYLPAMRSVSYQFLTSQFRYLTDDEILDIYASDPKSLSRNEFFRLYRNLAKTDAEREEYLRKALEVYPKFLVAATDLASMMIKRGTPDYNLLAPYLTPDAKNIPDEAKLNHIVACLANNKYHEADSLAALLPDTEQYHKAKIYTAVFNGRYHESIGEIAAESPVNEVVLLLALKANNHAWEKAQNLGETAEEEYLKAVAANRVDEYMEAVEHLDRAIELKPELREIARIDGDLIELMKEKDELEAQSQDGL